MSHPACFYNPFTTGRNKSYTNSKYIVANVGAVVKKVYESQRIIELIADVYVQYYYNVDFIPFCFCRCFHVRKSVVTVETTVRIYW